MFGRETEMMSINSYSETIDTLYKSNSFYFSSMTDVLRLALTILPERMLLITDVSVVQ